MRVTTASTIDGFTIRNGITEDGSGADNNRRAGGLLTYGAPSIRNCYFTQNYGYFGGGLYPRGGGAAGVVIENCVFENNTGGFGAGIYINSTNGTITSCEFNGNVCDTRGGAVYNNTAEGTMITNCVFENNHAKEALGKVA